MSPFEGKRGPKRGETRLLIRFWCKNKQQMCWVVDLIGLVFFVEFDVFFLSQFWFIACVFFFCLCTKMTGTKTEKHNPGSRTV